MSKKNSKSVLSFSKAIKMGEYYPEFLATYPEWHKYSRHVQFEYIQKAIKNRKEQLTRQWAEVNNILDFSKKPHLKEVLKNITKQLEAVEEDRESLFLKYSKT